MEKSGMHSIVDDFLTQFIRIPDQPYDPERGLDLGHYFRSFSECVVGETINRLDPFLIAIGRKAQADGSCTVGNLVITIASEDQETIHYLLSDTDGLPLFKISRTWEMKDGDEKVSTQFFRVDPEAPDYPYPERIASNFWMKHAKSDRIYSRGTCQCENFAKFVEFAQFLDNARQVGADIEENAQLPHLFPEVAAVLQQDGGIAGPTALSVAVAIQQKWACRALEWAMGATVELAAAQKDKGLVWGQSYLLYNDLDISACCLPMADPRKVAVFNQNVSLFSDDFGHIAVVDHDEDGQPISLTVTAVNRNEKVSDVVETVISGNGAKEPTFQFSPSRDDMDRLRVHGSQLDESGLLNQFAFQLSFDHEVIVAGAMHGEREDDCEIKTDFETFEFDEEEDLAEMQP